MVRTPSRQDEPQDSRLRMVQSAATLFRSRGLSATSFSDVLDHSGAPRGSIYHHFPHGKRQLAQAAVQHTAEWLLTYQRAYEGTDAAGVLRHFTAIWRRLVLSTPERPGSAGCAVAAVALDTLDTPEDAALMLAVRETFGAWTILLTAQLQAAGLGPSRASAVAVMAVASMEGALVLCRAQGSPDPIDVVTAELLRLISV